MLYLCERYAPLESLEKYDPMQDIGVTGVLEPYDIHAGVGTGQQPSLISTDEVDEV